MYIYISKYVVINTNAYWDFTDIVSGISEDSTSAKPSLLLLQTGSV